MNEERARVQQQQQRTTETGETTISIEPARRIGRKPVPSLEERTIALHSILNYMDNVFHSDFLHRYDRGETDSSGKKH
jgi:hypothetical protein